MEDSLSRVGCEVVAGKNTIFVTGEITSKATIDIEKEVRKAIRFLAAIIDNALGQTDCALSYKEWDMLRNLKDGNYGELDE